MAVNLLLTQRDEARVKDNIPSLIIIMKSINKNFEKGANGKKEFGTFKYDKKTLKKCCSLYARE